MSTMVRNAGIAISTSPHSMPRTWAIIRNPTRTSAGVAASYGTISTRGARKVASRKHTPVTMLARPVRAPSPTPAADSMYDVLLETDAAPPAAAATESTIRMRSVFGGLPSSSSRLPSAPTATIVPIVSKKSASSRVNTNSPAVRTPTASHEPSRLNWPSNPKSGESTIRLGSTGTFRPHPLGFASPSSPTDGPMSNSASTRMASTVAPRIVHRIAPLTLRTYRKIRDCGEDRGPEAGQHQDQDDQAFDHHQSHRVGPRHPAGDRKRDEGVQTQSGGQRERIVGERPHGDRHDTGDQGGGGCDQGQVGRATAAEEVTLGVRLRPDDQRVEHDDVGHREERDQPAPDLAAGGRAALADLEVPVEAVRGLGVRGGRLRHSLLPGVEVRQVPAA